MLTLAGVLTAAAWWRKEGRKVHGRDWRSLPGKISRYNAVGHVQALQAPRYYHWEQGKRMHLFTEFAKGCAKGCAD